MQLFNFLLFTGLIKVCFLLPWLPQPFEAFSFSVVLTIVCQLIYGGKGLETASERQIGLSHPVPSHLWSKPRPVLVLASTPTCSITSLCLSVGNSCNFSESDCFSSILIIQVSKNSGQCILSPGAPIIFLCLVCLHHTCVCVCKSVYVSANEYVYNIPVRKD